MKFTSIALLLFVIFSGCSKKEDDGTISSTGTIESVNVTISSKVAGQIDALNFKEGDKIKEGDLLLTIDHDLLDIQLRQAQAGVDLAQAQYNLVKNGATKNDIKIQSDLVEQARINLDAAKTDRDRTENLYKENSITKQQYDNALSRYDLAAAQYQTAKDNLNKIKNITRPEDIESARANLNKAMSAYDLLKQNINDCSVYAPVNGIISKKFIEKGEIVNPQSSLLKISDLETVNLMIYISETELGKVKLNETADVTVDAYKDKVYKGRVIFISPEAEFTPKNIQTKDERTKLVFGVKLEIPNPQFDLKPGMPADAKLFIK
ncbi:MAG: efflux RND transporter periplasmic adaptor subunit [Ignavibacteria bacterium]|nr:efflux RND transporter periplasmic adaptor subunit [Ignavibacteria bacterium]